jgi:hypothetical protein
MIPQQIVSRFDAFLVELGLSFEAIIIGGAALGLMGVTSRQTRDCDVLDPPLPRLIHEAALAFAARQRDQGEMLDDDWLNDKPSSLVNALPPGWRDRLQLVFSGNAVLLRTLGRQELLMSKLFALCDRGLDLPDCLALAPTPAELDQVRPWLEVQDANPDWPRHVRETLEHLRKELGHVV